MSKLLIVNADDFGLTEGISDGIIECHKNGIVTSTSIIASGSAFAKAVELTRGCPNLSVGVHLALIEEKPVLSPASIPTLVGKNGRFIKNYKQFFFKYIAGKINISEVWDELEAQIVKVKSTGINISHVDSHQHLHMLPDIFREVVFLAKKHGITHVRIPRERSFNLKCWGLQVMCMLNRTVLIHSGLKFPQAFYGMRDSGRMSFENFNKIINGLKEGYNEIMVHPGNEDMNYLENYKKHWCYHPEDEKKVLCDSRIPVFLKEQGVKLINYNF
ncbi:MAG: ChbG/HpnK family deacetylase [Elusimicrobia bacterium]|nr:ChbG/HpnK family deacetylase [Elusimicrobiota bacterium]